MYNVKRFRTSMGHRDETGQVPWGALPLFDPTYAPQEPGEVPGTSTQTESQAVFNASTQTEEEYETEGFATQEEYDNFNESIAEQNQALRDEAAQNRIGELEGQREQDQRTIQNQQEDIARMQQVPTPTAQAANNNAIVAQQQYLRDAEVADLRARVADSDQVIQDLQKYINDKGQSGTPISSALGSAAGSAAATAVGAGLRVAGRQVMSAMSAGAQAAGRGAFNFAAGAAAGAFNAVTAESGSSGEPIDLEGGQGRRVGGGPPNRQAAFTPAPQTDAPPDAPPDAPRQFNRPGRGVNTSGYHYH